MSDTTTAKPDAVVPVAVEQPAPLTTTPSTQANAWGSIGVGTMGATVMMWLYKGRTGTEMPTDVANSITGLAIFAVHALQHAALAFLEWKRPKS